MSLLNFVRRAWRRLVNPPPRGSAAYWIVIDEERMRLLRCDRPEDAVWEVQWARIVEAVAFKRDLYAVDQICMRFDTAEFTHEVNEEMGGWSEMLAALPELLPSAAPQPEWWAGVAFPAFETNATTVFIRD